jgi:hypothetical protein
MDLNNRHQLSFGGQSARKVCSPLTVCHLRCFLAARSCFEFRCCAQAHTGHRSMFAVLFRAGRCRYTKDEGCPNAGVPGAGRRVPGRGRTGVRGSFLQGFHLGPRARLARDNLTSMGP